jgi:hypothetical protein
MVWFLSLLTFTGKCRCCVYSVFVYLIPSRPLPKSNICSSPLPPPYRTSSKPIAVHISYNSSVVQKMKQHSTRGGGSVRVRKIFLPTPNKSPWTQGFCFPIFNHPLPEYSTNRDHARIHTPLNLFSDADSVPPPEPKGITKGINGGLSSTRGGSSSLIG